jgi:hypothetical protein
MRFTVTLARKAIEWNTVEVEADTPAEACAKAMIADDGDYQPGDFDEPFVDTLQRGGAFGIELPIPRDYRRAGER